jgi:predicted secreted protein
MKTIKILLCSFVYVLLLLSCEKKDDNLADYTLRTNDTVQISLRSESFDGGFRWCLANSSSISIVDSINWQFKLDNNLVGSPGSELWKFKAVKKGVDIIRFEYKRPWEQTILETREIMVKVK